MMAICIALIKFECSRDIQHWMRIVSRSLFGSPCSKETFPFCFFAMIECEEVVSVKTIHCWITLNNRHVSQQSNGFRFKYPTICNRLCTQWAMKSSYVRRKLYRLNDTLCVDYLAPITSCLKLQIASCTSVPICAVSLISFFFLPNFCKSTTPDYVRQLSFNWRRYYLRWNGTGEQSLEYFGQWMSLFV